MAPLSPLAKHFAGAFMPAVCLGLLGATYLIHRAVFLARRSLRGGGAVHNPSQHHFDNAPYLRSVLGFFVFRSALHGTLTFPLHCSR